MSINQKNFSVARIAELSRSPRCKRRLTGGHWLVQMEWQRARWLVYLPLLIFHCTIKSRSSLLAPAHMGGPKKRAIKRLCVCD